MLQPEARVVVWPSLNITGSGSNQIQKYRSDICDYWDDLGFYHNFTLPTPAPEETTTSGFESASAYFSIISFLASIILLKIFAWKI